MKLSSDTLSILKNFASINPGLEFKAGNVIQTISPGKTILAKASLKDSFPEDFCVYDLNQFLSVYSLSKDADIGFDSANIILQSGKSKIKYRKSSRETIILPPDKTLSLPSVDVSFKLEESVLSDVMKSANVLQSPNISVESKDGRIFITCFDSKDDSAHTRSIEVSESNGNEFKMVFLTENWKIIPGSYDVEISSRGLASFKHTIQEVDYWIAIETKESKFGE
jgi:hypothetical protein